MKLRFDREWAKCRIAESPDDEPYVIGPIGELPMDNTAVIDCYISGKIEYLELKIEEEMKAIRERNGDHGTPFSNAGSTDTLKWRAQIEALKEFEKFHADLTTMTKV